MSSPQRVDAVVDGTCANLPAMPSPQDYLTDEELDAAVLEAQRFAFVVHEYDQAQVCQLIGHLERTGQVRAVLVTLAAMVDIDRPVSELLGWVLAATERRPWQRESYPACDPADDNAPSSCRSRHGTPARHTAGCRGEGCRLARADYDRFRYEGKGPRPAHVLT